jgi:hypothetical protein
MMTPAAATATATGTATATAVEAAPVVQKKESVAKNVALFFAAPFIGLAYIVAFPFVAIYAIAKHGWKAATKS